MAGLDPAIHVFARDREEDVDARHKAGHDVESETERLEWPSPTDWSCSGSII
jgi:hypothetical protein